MHATIAALVQQTAKLVVHESARARVNVFRGAK